MSKSLLKFLPLSTYYLLEQTLADGQDKSRVNHVYNKLLKWDSDFHQIVFRLSLGEREKVYHILGYAFQLSNQ